MSVVIATHGDGRCLPELLGDLLRLDPPPRQIIVVADKPTPRLLARLPRSPRVELVVRGERLGKVSALNHAIGLADGEAILFLDDDVRVADRALIARVAEALKTSDIADIGKLVEGEGLLAGLVYVEYLGLNLASMILARIAQRSPAVNGAAFAATRSLVERLGGFRPVLYEDLDFATRAFLQGARYSYVHTSRVTNMPPRTWREWLRQRRRWSIGAALWLREYLRPLLAAIRDMPHAAAAALVVALPSLVSTAVVFLYEATPANKLAYLVLLLASSMLSQLLPVASLLSVNLHLALAARLMVLLAMLAALSAPYAAAARLLGVKARAALYPIYLLVYQPLWFTVLLGGMVRVYLLGREEAEDWVVPREG